MKKLLIVFSILTSLMFVSCENSDKKDECCEGKKECCEKDKNKEKCKEECKKDEEEACCKKSEKKCDSDAKKECCSKKDSTKAQASPILNSTVEEITVSVDSSTAE